MNFLKKLFGVDRQKTVPLPRQDQVSTAPLGERSVQPMPAERPAYDPPQLVYGCGQSVGRQREHNEDSLLAVTMALGGENGSQPFGLYAVADGMGGHQHGEMASIIAIRAFASYVLQKLQPFVLRTGRTLDEPLQDVMRNAIDEAQRAVIRSVPGSGTTLTAAMVLGQQMIIGHVGDSRAYTVYPDGRVEVLTRDHSLVKRLEELGQISAEEAAVHPQRNVLYRAIGQGDFLEADIFTTPFPKGGYLLLCSDGLWGVVLAEHMQRIIKESASLPAACQKLIAAANKAGGPDNISAILVQLLL